MINKSVLLGTSIFVAAALAAPAFAQDDEIVITATKREQTLQDVPVAVSVVQAQDIDRAEIQDINDLQSLVPSLRVGQLQSSANTNFIIRGFGNGANNPGIEPSVGVFIDGVYRSRSAAQISDLPDLQRVEVLRGPQSTLFGKNASAGVISVVTAKPSFEWGGFLEGSYGNYDYKGLRGKVTGPLSDTVAFAVSGSYNKRDGYYENLVSGNSINDRDRYSVRGDLLMEPTDNSSFRLQADYESIDEVCCGAGNLLDGPTGGAVRALGGNLASEDLFSRDLFYNKDPENKIENSGISLTGDIDFENFTLTSITAFRTVDAAEDYDADFTSADLIAGRATQTKIDTFTQEVRFAGSTEQADWLLGGFYFDEKIDYYDEITFGADFRGYANILGDAGAFQILEIASGNAPGTTFFAQGQGTFENDTQDNQAYTLFGNVDWHLSDRLTATVGLSYTSDKKDVVVNQTNTDVYSSLDLDVLSTSAAFSQTVFGAVFGQVTGLAPTPANIGAFVSDPGNAATVAFINATAAGTEAAIQGAVPALQGLQFLPQFVNFPNSVEDGSSDDSKTTYTLRLAYDVNDNINVYGSYATGFKATSWNLSRDSRPFATDQTAIEAAGLDQNNQTYGTRFAGPEDAKVFEVGLKGKWDNFAANVAVFDQTIEGFQSNLFIGTGFVLGNAGKQSTKGVEVDAVFTPTDNWKFNFAGTFMDPKYDSFPGAAGPTGPVDLSGQTPAGIHKTSMSFGTTYEWSVNDYDGYIRADYQYEDDIQVVDNVDKAFASREVKQLNASAGFEKDGFAISIWGRNLTDEDYIISAFPSVAQTGSLSGYANAPKTYGVTLRANW